MLEKRDIGFDRFIANFHAVDTGYLDRLLEKKLLSRGEYHLLIEMSENSRTRSSINRKLMELLDAKPYDSVVQAISLIMMN